MSARDRRSRAVTLIVGLAAVLPSALAAPADPRCLPNSSVVGLIAADIAAAAPGAAVAASGKTPASPSARSMESHVRFLADDLLEGRGPGTRGGDLAARYIAERFRALGMEPAGGDGTFLQQIPLFGVKSDQTAQLLVKRLNGGPPDSIGMLLNFGDEWVGSTSAQQDVVIVDAPIVFAGYGITAPEAKWDDWKDVDVRGKAVVLLVNDPPAPAAEPALFGGRSLTYYGRWTYKYEEAARRGAVAVLLVHTDASAGYPWSVVRTSNGGWRFEPERPPETKESPHVLTLKSWISTDSARRLFAQSAEGLELETLVRAASSREFRPVDLGLLARIRLKSDTKRVRAPNVAGIVRGTDPKLANEYVVVTAHWDHLGVGEADPSGDTIYNGAVDNATGVAGMLGIAEALAAARPKRSVLFIATTAEEQGLIGAHWWADHPTVPLDAVVANVNLDPMNVEGLVDDIVPLGAERSSLEQVIAAVAKERKLAVEKDPRPEQGTFYRSDHFPFARKGIPAVGLKTGTRYRNRPAGWAEERFRTFNSERYHQPSDEVLDSFDWAALSQHAEIAQAIIVRIANAPARPKLDPDDEFAPKPAP